jgi:hypothetical protein
MLCGGLIGKCTSQLPSVSEASRSISVKSPPRVADDPRMAWIQPEHWFSFAAALGFAAFSACAVMAFTLDTVARVSELKLEARRLQLKARADRAKRLNR